MQDSDEVVAIALATQALRWRVKTGPMPADVFGTADGKSLRVGMTSGDSVEVYDLGGAQPRLARSIKTGAGAHALRAAGDGRHVFVSNRVANTIRKIDLQAGDGSLGNQWAAWWRARAAEGHEFASHTWDHVYWRGDVAGEAPR